MIVDCSITLIVLKTIIVLQPAMLHYNYKLAVLYYVNILAVLHYNSKLQCYTDSIIDYNNVTIGSVTANSVIL